VAAQLDNLRIGGEGAYFDWKSEQDRQLAFIERRMVDEFKGALAIDPNAHVKTPGWGARRSHAAVLDVIADNFAGEGDTSLLDLLRYVSRRAKAGDPEALGWIDAAAKRYAKFHAGDEL
jgi:hypothetical protein